MKMDFNIKTDFSRSQFEALRQYNKPERVPLGNMLFSEGFAIKNAGLNIAKIFHDPETIYRAVYWAADQYRWNPFVQYSSFSVLGCFDFGGTMRYPQNEGDSIGALLHPVQNEKDVDRLKLPDSKESGDIPRQFEFATLQKKAGLPVTFFSRSPFCMASNMCGIERFFEWLVGKPELCERVMEMGYQHTINVLDYWIASFGAENIQVWMSTPVESNQLISPKHMEQFCLPYHMKYHDHLEKVGIKRCGLHLCGEQNKNLQILSEASPWRHPTILSFGVEVDITKAAKLFPKDIICGNIDTNLIQTGTAREVYENCKSVIEKGKRIEGGFILAPGCETPPFAPPANVYAMTRAAEDFGSY
jgi:uroporphyrinogen decarboxylase